jgi:hypothetical protein
MSTSPVARLEQLVEELYRFLASLSENELEEVVLYIAEKCSSELLEPFSEFLEKVKRSESQVFKLYCYILILGMFDRLVMEKLTADTSHKYLPLITHLDAYVQASRLLTSLLACMKLGLYVLGKYLSEGREPPLSAINDFAELCSIYLQAHRIYDKIGKDAVTALKKYLEEARSERA